MTTNTYLAHRADQLIEPTYTLFLRVPIYQNGQGQYFADELWAKDLALHLDYLANFNLCCPVVRTNAVAGMVEISHLAIKRIFPLRLDKGYLSILINLIPNFYQTIKACHQSKIVHSDAGGWAFPLSFYILLIRFFMDFNWLIIMESSFWMIKPGEKTSLFKKINHVLHHVLLKHAFAKANARIFTQTFYRQYFLADDTRNTLIAPAVWVNSQDLINANLLEIKPINQRVKIIYPSRLVEEKGAQLVLDALKLAQSRGLSLDLTIIGEGPLFESLQQFAAQYDGDLRLLVLPPVQYGQVFFSLLQEYDALLVANIKEEQPRIIFDAFSQGLGVIAADTTGILDIVKVDENAILFKQANATSLLDALIYATKHPEKIRLMGKKGLEAMRGKNHQQMHINRMEFIKKTMIDIQ